MKIKYGSGTTIYGPGIDIILTPEDIVRAINAYLVSRGIYIEGARTMIVNEDSIQSGKIYIDPSGSLLLNGRRISGRGNIKA